MDRKEQIKQLENEWNSSDRWANVKRGYKAEDVVRLRGSFVPECSIAKKGAEKLWSLVNGSAKKGYVNCLGALTGGQAMQQVKAGIEAIYLSGWQVAADANTSETMYPDQSLYAYDSVPTVVRRINNNSQPFCSKNKEILLVLCCISPKVIFLSSKTIATLFG